MSQEHVLHPGKGFGVSAYVQELACYVGQKEVFDEAQDSLLRLSGIELSDKQIERICHHHGELVGELLHQEEENLSIQRGELHYAMADGSMLLTREKEEQTGKAKWSEMKLGRIFKAAEHFSLGTQEESRKWIRTSEYVAHFGNCDEFFEKFMVKLDRLKKFIFIADGASWIWERVKAFYPNAIQILDFYHAMQHLWKLILLCWTLNFDTKEAQNQWVAEQKKLLLNDQLEQVIENIQALEVKTLQAVEEKAKLIQYYQNNKERMNYGTYLANGWLIGSGPIESAHRDVIKKRLKLSGQRWTKPGAQQVANLRVAYKSNEWEKVRQVAKRRA